MLNQPFQILKKVGSIRPRHFGSKNRSGQSRVLGIDLGLVHWATISVMDTIEKKELKNYFLDSRRVFDCRYDRYLKKNVVHERFFNPTDKNMRAKDSNFVEGVRLSSRVDVNMVYKNLRNINQQLELDRQTREAYFMRVLAQRGLEALSPETFKRLYTAFLGGPTPEFRALLEKLAPKKHHTYILHILEALKNHQLEVPIRSQSSEKDITPAFNKIIRKLMYSPLPKTYDLLSKKDPDKFAHLITGGILSYLSAVRFFRRKIMVEEDTLRGNIEEVERGLEHEKARPLGFKTIAHLLGDTSAAEVRKFFTLTFQKTYLRPMNIKRKLMVLRSELRSIRREINTFENNYKGKLYKSRKYYHLTQNERYLSEKLSNIHEDIVHNVARRIIEISRSWGNIPVLFENLKWSRHSSKRNVGTYLAHHQTHWFFSQIIGFTIDLARRYEIPVKLVNARNTSKKCWKCGRYGARGGKEFTCNEHGGYRVDTDLNAARNIALGIKA